MGPGPTADPLPAVLVAGTAGPVSSEGCPQEASTAGKGETQKPQGAEAGRRWWTQRDVAGKLPGPGR